jgi:MYXO-CTERM domain-containing protein
MRSYARRLSYRLPACLLAVLLLAPAAASAAQVWTASSLEKIRPSVAARTDSAASLSAAKNEHASFQIVVTGPATGVRATASDLTGPASLSGVRLYREALINVKTASAADGATGMWPDALVPDVDELVGEKRNAFPFDVPAGESRAIWVEVLVPKAAPAGDYRGTVSVTWSGGAATVPVSLHVWPFSLPSTASLKSAFGFAWGAIPAGHGMSAGDAYSRLRARYGELALDHRVTLSHVDDGNAATDHVGQYYGPALDGTSPAELAGAKMTSFELMGNAASWATFFSGRGWSDRLFQYTCDEPPATCAWSDIPARAATAHAASPAIRTLVTTTIQEADDHGVTSSIDILVPVINDLDDKPNASRWSGNQRSKYDGFLAGSPRRQLWVYQSCMSHGCGGGSDPYFTGWPSYMIDASAVRNRAMQWLAFQFQVSGELYFETTMAYSHDPWNNQWDFGGNGDGTLFYPGTPAKIGGSTDVPVASIRLKELRDGMQDYEYLKLVSDLGDPGLARSVAAALFPHPYQTEVAPANLLAARAKLAARIVELSGGVDPGAGASGLPAPAADEQTLGGGGCSTGTGGLGGVLAVLALAAFGLRRRRR